MQIDWPQEAGMMSIITQKIMSRRCFSYPLFQAYIICVDILEELTYLWTDHGGGVLLDIAVNTGILQSKIKVRNKIAIIIQIFKFSTYCRSQNFYARS